MKPSRTTSQGTARPQVVDAGDATPGPSASQPWRGAALDRRRALAVFAATTAVAATGTALRPARAAVVERAVSPETTEVYRRAMVIDGSNGVGLLDPEWSPGKPPPARWLREIAASGITAVLGGVSVSDGLGPTMQNLAGYEAAFAAYPKLYARVRSAAELAALKQSGRLGFIYGMQFPDVLGARFELLDMFHNLGVRVIQPTYNRRSAFGDGCLEPENRGLTPVGRDLVAALNERRILLDLSHAGSRTQADGVAATKAPCAISHTGCRALADLPRNTRDEEIRAVADKGGVIGIYFMPFLRTGGAPTSDDVVRHVEHALNVAGEDHVGIGTDGGIPSIADETWYRTAAAKDVEDRRRKGISAPGEDPDAPPYVPDYNSSRRMELLADDLIRRGHPPRRVEKILGGNFARLFSEVWG